MYAHDTITTPQQASTTAYLIGPDDPLAPPTNQPWARLSLTELMRSRDTYWDWLKKPELPYRARYQLDRHCAEIVEEIGRRLVVITREAAR